MNLYIVILGGILSVYGVFLVLTKNPKYVIKISYRMIMHKMEDEKSRSYTEMYGILLFIFGFALLILGFVY